MLLKRYFGEIYSDFNKHLSTEIGMIVKSAYECILFDY